MKALVAFGLWLLVSSTARAEGEPMGVLLRTRGRADAELVERVSGQLVDLPVRLSTLAGEAVSPHLPTALEQARALAREHDARAVVWFVESPELTAHVAEPAAQRLLVRQLGPPAEGAARSAQLEAAALVVRTALRALSSGGEIGVDEREVVSASRPPDERKAAPEPPAEPSFDNEAIEEKRVSLPWLLGAGFQVVVDGESPRGSQAVQAAFGVGVGPRSALWVRGAVGLRAHLEQPDARLSLARHSAELWASVAMLQRRRWQLDAAAGVGAAVFRTRAGSRSAGFEPEPVGRTALPLLGCELQVRHFPGFTKGRVGWSLSLGADVLPWAPELVVEEGGAPVVRERLWSVAPRMILSLWVRAR